MDITFIIAAVIFTLLAVVVATSVFSGPSSSVDSASDRGHADGAKEGLDRSGVWHNGRIPDQKRPADWGELSESSHDHWEVVRSARTEESQDTAGHAPSSQSDDPRCVRPQFDLDPPSLDPSSRDPPSLDPSSLDPSSLDPPSLDPPAAAPSSGGGRRSLIGLSDKELLQCAFSYPQTEGATEGPGVDDMKYLPRLARPNHMETMMSKQELEEEQRVQREQLAAIFQLLKENKETFGEVSERDLEDQFRLYSI